MHQTLFHFMLKCVTLKFVLGISPYSWLATTKFIFQWMVFSFKNEWFWILHQNNPCKREKNQWNGIFLARNFMNGFHFWLHAYLQYHNKIKVQTCTFLWLFPLKQNDKTLIFSSIVPSFQYDMHSWSIQVNGFTPWALLSLTWDYFIGLE